MELLASYQYGGPNSIFIYQLRVGALLVRALDHPPHPVCLYHPQRRYYCSSCKPLTMVLEESSTCVSCLHKQIPFDPFWTTSTTLTRLHVDSDIYILTRSPTRSLTRSLTQSITPLLPTPFIYIYHLISIDLELSRSFNSPILYCYI